MKQTDDAYKTCRGSWPYFDTKSKDEERGRSTSCARDRPAPEGIASLTLALYSHETLHNYV